MKTKELRQIGLRTPGEIKAAQSAIARAAAAGMRGKEIRKTLKLLIRNPSAGAAHGAFEALAELLRNREADALPVAGHDYAQRAPAPYAQWGEDLDPKSAAQMQTALRLPIAVRGALMPDAHVGYGLPIGGVLAAENAVIPYAVGVDIACRMKMTVYDLPVETIDERAGWLQDAILAETRFGVGASFKHKREHSVLDKDWHVSPVTARNKDKAWAQLGTSGSGNHFVEFGELEVLDPDAGLAPGRYLALLSHSGSRGTGAQVCKHYSDLAKARHPELPAEARHLAWLDLDSHEGQEYWCAMELMGEYAAANHACIHRHIAAFLGARVLLDVENHHNFAWKEVHDGRQVVVHRKGATPASQGVLGIIPGSMATPGFLVRGRGVDASLHSAAHGAGRVMSRSAARRQLKWRDAKGLLEYRKVTLMSAGLDEAPMVYKDIHEVMRAQSDLVDTLARFDPRIVRMAQDGERPED